MDDTIGLIANTDGLPIFKSKNVQLLPILCRFYKFDPFLVALYCGNSKPSSPNEFFYDFLEEYSRLKENGIVVNGTVFNVRLLFFACTTPAGQLLKQVKGHSGFYSCEGCTVKGESIDGRPFMATVDCQPTIYEAFQHYEYHLMHQLKRSLLPNYGALCISKFVLDYIHAFSMLGGNKADFDLHEQRTA